MHKGLPIHWATFVAKNFKKLPNLVTLTTDLCVKRTKINKKAIWDHFNNYDIFNAIF